MYILYVLFTGIILPVVHTPPERVERELAFTETTEQVALLEYGPDAFAARLDIIEEAQESIDVAYYYMDEGISVKTFNSYILAAADRGVKVRYLLDGIKHGLRGEYRGVFHLFNEHPNIELKLYEPFPSTILFPWRTNNRLHDKLLIVDEAYSIIGGRNIGDIYFQRPEPTDPYSFDRDVLLINTNEQENSFVGQMKSYYTDLWETDFAVSQTNATLFPWQKSRGDNQEEELDDIYQTHREEKETAESTTDMTHWNEQSVEIDQAYFTSNSLERQFKDPYVWSDLLTLASQAEESIIIQSPWVVPDRQMRKELEKETYHAKEGYILTNAASTTNNIIGQSGTENRKQDFIDSQLDYYEFQPSHSSLHTKLLVVDEQISAVGTFNFDARSTYFSTESMLFIDSDALASQIIEEIETTYLRKSALYEEDGDVITGEDTDYVEPSVWRRIGIYILRPFAWLAERLI